MAKDDDKKGNEQSYPGMYNFQGIMDSFYDYKPGADDDVGNSIKNTFAANMIQSAFDKDMAKEMGQYQNALGQSNMQLAADLELANNSAMMEQEFKYGMDSMGAQFGFQNEFANAQFDRDVAMTAAVGEDTRKTQDNESFNRKQETIVGGEQQRLTDTNRISQTGEEQRKNLAVEGGEQRLTDTNKSQLAREETRVTGEEQRATDKNRIETTGEQSRLNTMVEGDQQRQTDTNKIVTTAGENRKTMDFENRLQAKTRADQSKYSRQTARGF